MDVDMIQIKRAYDPPAKTDGHRLLVERLWPRGTKKEALHLSGWIKEVAPSTELRRWFGHNPAQWEEFQRRYRAELEEYPEAWSPIPDVARKKRETLLFSSHDAEHNNVVALKSYSEKQIRSKRKE